MTTHNKHHFSVTAVAATLLVISSAAWAAEFQVVSKNSAFSVKTLMIKVGDTAPDFAHKP